MTRFSDLTRDCQEESKSKSRIPILSLCFVFCSIFLLHKLLCKKKPRKLGSMPRCSLILQAGRRGCTSVCGGRLPHPTPGCSCRRPFPMRTCVCRHLEGVRWPGQCTTLEPKENVADNEAQRSCASSRCLWTVCVSSLAGREVASAAERVSAPWSDLGTYGTWPPGWSRTTWGTSRRDTCPPCQRPDAFSSCVMFKMPIRLAGFSPK